MKRFIAIVLLILVVFAFAYIIYVRVMGYGTTSPDDWDTRPGVSVNGNTYVCAGHVMQRLAQVIFMRTMIFISRCSTHG
jgi:FlaG/FlaF family flagellin (archaellin)